MSHCRCHGCSTHPQWNTQDISLFSICQPLSRILLGQLWREVQEQFVWKGILVIWILLQKARQEFILVLDKVYVHHIHRNKRKTIILQISRDLPKKITVIIKFDLSRTIKNNIVVFTYKLIQFFLKPCLILQEIFHTE